MIDLPINLKSEDDFEPLELEIWFDSGFSTQISDMRPEVLKLRGYEGDALFTQWNTVIDLVSMTLLDPYVEQEDKDKVIASIEKLRGFYANKGVDEDEAFAWWEQLKEKECVYVDSEPQGDFEDIRYEEKDSCYLFSCAGEEARSDLVDIENIYLDDLNESGLSTESIDAIEVMPSDLDRLDMAWCILTAVTSTFITTNEDFAKWCEEVHDAASEKSGDFDFIQRLLGKMFHHKGDMLDNFKSRDGQNAYAIFHRLLGGHDIFATGKSISPHNPFVMMKEQTGSWFEGVLQATRHLIADTFSSQGLPLPFTSYLDTTKDGKPWNKIIDIVQSLSVETTGDKKQAEAIYSHMFTLRAQDVLGGCAAFAMTSLYCKAREIEDGVRKAQLKLITYSLSFFGQAAVGAIRQKGVPYINHPLGMAMAAELVFLMVRSNKKTNQLDRKTQQLHQGAIIEVEKHDSLSDLF